MTAHDLLVDAVAELERAGVPSARVDAEWLLADALDVTRTALYANGATPLPASAERKFRAALERRVRREPLAYILGEWGFRRLTLRVDSRGLIPRPETEVLVERCLALLGGLAEPRVLDIGVGSGAIALAIADEHPGARVVATDTSPGALALAEENRRRFVAGERVELVEADLFSDVVGPFDVVVSNPPYVDAADVDSLEPEVRIYEPREALIATGMTERIIAGAGDVLRSGGALLLEVADGDARRVAADLERAGYDEVTITTDLAGRERIVDGRAR